MTDTRNARFLLARGIIAAVILGTAMARGLFAPAIAGGATSPSPDQVTELEVLGQYLARQPVHPRFVARALDGIALADSLNALAQAGRPFPTTPVLDVPQPVGLPVVIRWVVSAIMITESRRIAVVNDSLVSVGSAVGGGATVAAIEPDRVILLESGGTRRELRVQSGSQ